ncbi:MAG: hypothetical protein KY475_14390 [Planctomycetes bacterium]|nr:hypothetical protein [Planctomycetota bacterium]
MPKPIADVHGKGPTSGVDTSMKTFHEWLAEREQKQCEGLWLNEERRHRAVEAKPIATGFRRQQELEQKAKATALRRAGVQTVEA